MEVQLVQHPALVGQDSVDEAEARGRADPLAGVDAAVDPHGRLALARAVAGLEGRDLFFNYYY